MPRPGSSAIHYEITGYRPSTGKKNGRRRRAPYQNGGHRKIQSGKTGLFARRMRCLQALSHHRTPKTWGELGAYPRSRNRSFAQVVLAARSQTLRAPATETSSRREIAIQASTLLAAMSTSAALSALLRPDLPCAIRCSRPSSLPPSPFVPARHCGCCLHRRAVAKALGRSMNIIHA
jgi:hypothetical protein